VSQSPLVLDDTSGVIVRDTCDDVLAPAGRFTTPYPLSTHKLQTDEPVIHVLWWYDANVLKTSSVEDQSETQWRDDEWKDIIFQESALFVSLLENIEDHRVTSRQILDTEGCYLPFWSVVPATPDFDLSSTVDPNVSFRTSPPPISVVTKPTNSRIQQKNRHTPPTKSVFFGVGQQMTLDRTCFFFGYYKRQSER
jgi:hypothetical protein